MGKAAGSQRLRHMRRRRRLNRDQRLGGPKRDFHAPGVQMQAGSVERPGAIDRIAQNRPALAGGVDAQLMRAPGQRRHF